jgi:outer membrane protein OmpA-like peptidoglycan-associated protein
MNRNDAPRRSVEQTPFCSTLIQKDQAYQQEVSLWFSSILILLGGGLIFAQQPDVNQQRSSPAEQVDHTPVFRVNVVSRTTKAVNYRHHSGKTDLDFAGTTLMPQARGLAKVESRTGRIEINADFDNLEAPRTFGPEYLTYVVWAVTPEDRASNLGEIVPHDGKSSVRVSTDLQAFGLIVTAEPYFAVTRPSDLVVLENIVKPSTKGWEEPIDTKFDLLERGQYTIDANPAQLPATSAERNAPTDLLEARNAVAIARAEGAERYAPDALRKAEDFLNRGEDYLSQKQSQKVISTVARGAVESAEDARVLSIRKRQEEQQEAERRATEQRAAQARSEADQARAQAQQENERRREAEQERRAAEHAKAEAESARQEAEAAKAQAVAEQQTAQAQAQQAESQAQQARLTAQQAEQARLQTQQEALQTRQRLLQQLNQVLQTRETARGLIVDMPDVLFDTDQHTLKPGARERLAKVAGILPAYPDLNVTVEGHTDNLGRVEYNQQLSEQRANSVREFLIKQGVRPENIQSRGFGMTQPVASNSTRTGRQLNRRVDLVVSGQAIGSAAGITGQEQPSTPTPVGPPTSQQPGNTGPQMQPVPTQPPPPLNTNPQPPQ